MKIQRVVYNVILRSKLFDPRIIRKYRKMASSNVVDLTQSPTYTMNAGAHSDCGFRPTNAPNFRTWEKVSTGHNYSTKNDFVFRVMSYNILSQILLEFHKYLYKDCAEDALIWEKRFNIIYKEILKVNPDIICLQEMQFDHVEFFNSHLFKHGYKSIYKQRTGIRVDGCAIYYKSSLFDLMDHESVEFRQPDADLLNRDNIGLMAKLRPKLAPSVPLIVCTTHLLYNPKRTDVRLAQMQVFLAEIDRFSFYSDSKSTRHLPVIITGDFNSFPDSAVIKLLIEGRIHWNSYNSIMKNIAITNACQHLGVYLQRNKNRKIKDSEVSKLYHSDNMIIVDSDDETVEQINIDNYHSLFSEKYLKHNLHLKSAYDFVKSDGVIEATTHQDEWVTVDYILFGSGNSSHLDLIERYSLPSERDCLEMGMIPNTRFGSDHFSLAASFRLRPKVPRSSV